MEITSELKKKFKILFFQILSYGETEAVADCWADAGGYVDEVFQLYIKKSTIKLSQEIKDFLREFAEEIYDDYYDGDRSMHIRFIFNAEEKTLEGEYTTYQTEEGEGGMADYSYEEIKSRYPRFDEFLEQRKYTNNEKVVITYDGGGDSGWINTDGQIDSEFEMVLYGFLSSSFGSWGNDDGSRGEIIIDPNTKSITIEHTDFYESSNTGSAETINFN